MLLELSNQFIIDIVQLKKENSKYIVKVWELIIDILKTPQNPLDGIGKPELLKGDLAGFYSRRITDKHRIIYRFDTGKLYLVSCYGHYNDK